MHKHISSDNLYKSYLNYEAYVDGQVRAGALEPGMARQLLVKAKSNYSNQNLNRQVDRINASGNTKKPTIYV
jgi:hypothetical protein